MPIVPLTITFNPLSPQSDQSQFSPNKINILSRENVVRINKNNNNLNQFYKEMYGDQSGEFVFGYFGGFKG